MNIWTIAAIIVGLFVIAGTVVMALSDNTNNSIKSENPESVSCSACNGGCTARTNCGLSSCEAVQGKTCNCSK